MLRSVACLVVDGVTPFEMGILCEVFGIDRSESGGPRFDFRLVTPEPGRPVRTSLGYTMTVQDGLEAADDVDLLAIPAVSDRAGIDARALELIRATVARGARVMSVCSGAFVLADAGVLDGREATTHWMHADELARQVPSARIDPNVLYVEDGPILTSAGTAAGIDAALHLVRSELGAAAAGVIARRMVVPPHRDGGQRQYIVDPVPECRADSLADLLAWMGENLAADLSVEALAARASVSTRTLARRFDAETGMTPGAWVRSQRLLLARRLLEETDDPVDDVAAASGFGTAAVLRHHMVRGMATTPTAYRRAFAVRGPEAALRGLTAAR